MAINTTNAWIPKQKAKLIISIIYKNTGGDIINNYFKICTLMKNNNIQYEEFSHEDITTFEQGMQLVKFERDKIVKTLAYKLDETIVLVAILGKDRLDYKKLAELLSIKRKQLTMMSKEEIEELGFEIGGVSPIVPDKNVEVFLEQKIRNLDYIYCGMGAKCKTLKISPKDLKILSKGKYVDVAKEVDIEEFER